MALVRTIAGYLALTIGVGLALLLIISLPPEQTPWGELALDQPIGPFTDMKLARLNNRDANCRILLEDSPVAFTPVPDRQVSQDCGFHDVVALDRSITPYSAPVQITCPVAAALYLWERDIVQPAAEFYFGQKVARIEHYGAYNCRRVNHADRGRMSEHASANAIDIAGFRLEDGRTVRIAGGWDGDTPEARFLREARDGACRTFRGVLSPDYNAAHHDHFHFDMGRFSLCR